MDLRKNHPGGNSGATYLTVSPFYRDNFLYRKLSEDPFLGKSKRSVIAKTRPVFLHMIYLYIVTTPTGHATSAQQGTTSMAFVQKSVLQFPPHFVPCSERIYAISFSHMLPDVEVRITANASLSHISNISRHKENQKPVLISSSDAQQQTVVQSYFIVCFVLSPPALFSFATAVSQRRFSFRSEDADVA